MASASRSWHALEFMSGPCKSFLLWGMPDGERYDLKHQMRAPERHLEALKPTRAFQRSKANFRS